MIQFWNSKYILKMKRMNAFTKIYIVHIAYKILFERSALSNCKQSLSISCHSSIFSVQTTHFQNYYFSEIANPLNQGCPTYGPRKHALRLLHFVIYTISSWTIPKPHFDSIHTGCRISMYLTF